MKKKIVSLLLTVTMVASLFAACGSAAEPAAPAAEPAAPAAEGSADAAPAAAGEAIDPLTIQFSTTYQETETGGVILKHFQETLEQSTNGAITINFMWGGTVFDTMGEFDAVKDGAVNMVALGHMPHTDKLNYLAFPGFAPGSPQAALDYFQTLMFDDPETSALIQGEAADYGIKYLNIIAGGANAFAAKYEFTDLASLVAGSASFGNFDAAIFEALGFNVAAVTPGDTYEALGNGMIDATQMGFAPMVAMSWQDNAKYWALDGTYTAGNPLTVNLEWWNSLTPAQQDAIQAAADEVQAYSATMYDDAIAGDIATVENATGNKFVEFSDEDIAAIWKAVFEAKADSALSLCEPNGKAEGMITILKKAAEITNYDWTAPQ